METTLYSVDKVTHVAIDGTYLCGITPHSFTDVKFETFRSTEMMILGGRVDFCPECQREFEKISFLKKAEKFSLEDLGQIIDEVKETIDVRKKLKIAVAKSAPCKGLLSEHYFAYIGSETGNNYRIGFCATDTSRKQMPKQAVTDYFASEKGAQCLVDRLNKNREEYLKEVDEATQGIAKKYEIIAKRIVEDTAEQFAFEE
ncbi:MAG: hypothetical protein PHT07_10335 [Paludibacter sp.]|nr:hypothetical protein [Paludibacter sp.]